jgi:hypothetical protein
VPVVGDVAGSVQVPLTGPSNNPITTTTGGAHTHTFERGASSTSAPYYSAGFPGRALEDCGPVCNAVSTATTNAGSHSHGLSGGDLETVPVNASVHYIIKD